QRRVSVTANASAGRSTGCGRSTRRNTTPVLGAAGRKVMVTFLPPCRPTPVALMADLSVRCFNIVLFDKDLHFSTRARIGRCPTQNRCAGAAYFSTSRREQM